MKKNIIILLLIPFIIALFSVITVNATVDIISPDILSIDWDYKDHVGFKKTNSMYQLHAVGHTANNISVAEGNQLVFEVENKDKSVEDPICEIVYSGGYYYLKTLNTGEVVITCRNKKGNVFKSMEATIYDKGAIIVNPVIGSSQNNIDPNIYYGSEDFLYEGNNYRKVPASFKLKFDTMPNSLSNLLTVEAFSRDNIQSVDLSTGEVKLREDAKGDAFIEFSLLNQDEIDNYIYKFKIIEDGVNVYTYQDLLNCTNKSINGEKVVLRKSFESSSMALDQTGSLKYNNIELFGSRSKDGKFNFKNEIYSFPTTFNDEYIKQWNEFATNNKDYKKISNEVKSGLHVMKDFYGNGYTINMHNLTYPTEKVQLENGAILPVLGKNDLFRGPLPFYTLGDPNGLPLITAFGQDNCGMYVDGDNITVNDVNLKNCDLENSLTNLEYVGTVMDVHGSNNTIKNSRLSNGKNVLRSYSNMDLDIDNCMLQNAMNFLMQVGTNEYIPLEKDSVQHFLNQNGVAMDETIGNYLKKESVGDKILNSFLEDTFDTQEERDKEKNILNALQLALNNKDLVENSYKNSVTVNDTMFYRSGIASISLDTLFNGPFLFSCSPSTIIDIFGQLNLESKPIVPLAAHEVSGISYPSKLNVSGKTKFYDYKDIKKMNITGLIKENISAIAKDLFDSTGGIGGIDHIPEINIDKIFPIKNLLEKVAGSKYSYTVTENGKTTKYVNIPFAYYGGGLNLTSIDTSLLECSPFISTKLEVDLLDAYLKLEGGEGLMSVMKSLMLKTVTTVTGFEPFNFVLMNNEGYLYGETPNVNDLKANYKE